MSSNDGWDEEAARRILSLAATEKWARMRRPTHHSTKTNNAAEFFWGVIGIVETEKITEDFFFATLRFDLKWPEEEINEAIRRLKLAAFE